MVNNIYIYKDPMTLDIVVAHYNSLAFFEILPAFSNRRNHLDGSKETTNILIYDKSENQNTNTNKICSFFSSFFFSTPSLLNLSKKYTNIKIRSRENNGREGETYLSHIIDTYDSLADYTCFIQDDIDNHLPKYEIFVYNTNITMQHNQPFYAYQCSWRKGGNPFFRTIINGIPVPELPTLPIPDAILQTAMKFNISLPVIYNTDICAFFIVSRDRIRARPITFYRELREWLLSDEANGFVLEHIWQLIFNQ
jgi:hypothetical protein